MYPTIEAQENMFMFQIPTIMLKAKMVPMAILMVMLLVQMVELEVLEAMEQAVEKEEMDQEGVKDLTVPVDQMDLTDQTVSITIMLLLFI